MKTKKMIFLFVALLFSNLIIIQFGCKKDDDTDNHHNGSGNSCEGITQIEYQGQVYEVVEIGEQYWFAENLNVGTMINGSEDMSDDGIIEKYCYDNDPANCDEYGGLYQWNEMMEYSTTAGVQGICPTGWHLPTDDEWKILEGTVDSQYSVGDSIWNNYGRRGYDAGKNLKSTTGWDSGGNGTNDFGFTAIPSGSRDTTGSFRHLTVGTCFWSSSENYSSVAWSRSMAFNAGYVYRNGNNKTHVASVA